MNLFDYVAKIKDIATHAIQAITNEEATKTALILPMISALGYDIFNPYELIPEMDCDLSRAGDKVDYAISINGSVRIIIECKHHRCNLSAHAPQLMKYYAASEAKCGILTNGIEYWFYSDTVKANIMDKEPFFKFNILEMGNDIVEELYMFTRERFSDEAIQRYIRESELRDMIIKSYRSNVTKMSDAFIGLILDSAGVAKSYENIELCREILASETGFEYVVQQNQGDMPSSNDESSLVDMARTILHELTDTSKLFSVKYKEHETLFMENQSKWLCRAYKGKGMIIFPPASESSTMDYSGESDLNKYKEHLINAAKSYDQHNNN